MVCRSFSPLLSYYKANYLTLCPPLQVANNGDNEGLFRAGFSNSGAQLPTGPIENGQDNYDFIAREVGCFNNATSLQCIRDAPYEALKAAMHKTPNVFAYQALVSGPSILIALMDTQLTTSAPSY